MSTADYMSLIFEQSNKTKYIKWYLQIIYHGIARQHTNPLSGYCEKHHILPKSFKMGGEKDQNNIVSLTAREHFICHLLLAKSFNGRFKSSMCYAVFLLRGLHTHTGSNVQINSIIYDRIKQEYSEICKHRTYSDATRKKMSAKQKQKWADGFQHSAETIDRLRQINTDKNPQAIPITFQGVEYPSYQAA